LVFVSNIRAYSHKISKTMRSFLLFASLLLSFFSVSTATRRWGEAAVLCYPGGMDESPKVNKVKATSTKRVKVAPTTKSKQDRKKVESRKPIAFISSNHAPERFSGF